MLPAIVSGLGRNQVGPGGRRAQSSGGLDDLFGGILGGNSGEDLFDQVLQPEPTPAQPGNDILGRIFGNKDVSRSVAEEAGEATGLSPALLRKMLPMLAMAVVGYMMRGKGGTGDGVLGGILGQIVGGMVRR